jgi:hypothetical protein
LTPEEWVRQNFLRYLIEDKNTPTSLIAVEYAFILNEMRRRSDIVVFNNMGKAVLVVECKSYAKKISQNVFDQITRYNMILHVAYLIVTNGLEHYCCKLNFEKHSYNFLTSIPNYKDMLIQVS